MNRINLYRNLTASSIALLLATGMSSCSDDSMDINRGDNREIRFDVGSVAARNDFHSTRGLNGGRTSGSVVPLEGAPSPLYLVTREKSGIDIDKEAKYSQTRGESVTTANLESVGVFAAQNPGGSSVEGLAPDYMYNIRIGRDGDWTPSEKYLWPGKGTLHINSYSPFCETPGTEGVVSLPQVTDKTPLNIKYIVPENVELQQDLLWGNPMDASSSPCELTFNHAMTAIRFAAGAELTPCTIEKIEIKGVASEGVLNLETGEWSEVTGNSDYSITPQISLESGSGSKYVEPGTELMSETETFILLPQTLGGEAKIVLTVGIDGKDYTMEASLDGEIWGDGKTITYRLSANPAKDELVLDVTGGFLTNYTGETSEFSVESMSRTDGTDAAIDWKAEFVDDEGNVIEMPGWITSFPMSGKGEGKYSYSTDLQRMIFNSISKESQILQNAANINSISGQKPYNLSNSTGGSSIENTANSYIINAPGAYSLPLVYGNGIKDGAVNSSAYVSTSHNRYALKNFINHLGNSITDPYIYNNSGCEPESAVLIWEDEIGLVRNVSLSEDKKSVRFYIPQNTIRQGNAVIGVRDSSGTIMWSWQIWVTDYKPSTESVGIDVNGVRHTLYTRNLGSVVGGDNVTFQESSVLVRFTQENVPEGMEPLTKTVELKQKGVTIATGDYNTYYQWGRKDPIMSAVKQWYNSLRQEIRQLTLRNVSSDLPAGSSLIEYWIRTPDIFWETTSGYKYNYTNLWNVSLETGGSEKSVYDPCPVGAKVPSGEEYLYLYQSGSFSWGKMGESYGFEVTAPDMDKTLFFTALGYRSLASGKEESNGITGEYWSARAATNRQDATCLTMQHKDDGSITLGHSDYRGHAFGVRPAME